MMIFSLMSHFRHFHCFSLLFAIDGFHYYISPNIFAISLY